MAFGDSRDDEPLLTAWTVFCERLQQAGERVFKDYNPATPLHRACQAVLSSRFRDKNWVFAHWSPGLMMSPRARQTWVEPDLLPLPMER